jgi:hypothetical protein
MTAPLPGWHRRQRKFWIRDRAAVGRLADFGWIWTAERPDGERIWGACLSRRTAMLAAEAETAGVVRDEGRFVEAFETLAKLWAGARDCHTRRGAP